MKRLPVLLLMFVVFALSACAPATGPTFITATPGPTEEVINDPLVHAYATNQPLPAVGQAVVLVTQEWIIPTSTPTQLVTSTETAPQGDQPTLDIPSEIPATNPPTSTVWISPNLQPGENPSCHAQNDSDAEIYAHLIKGDEQNPGCFINITTTTGYRRFGIYRIDGGLEKVIDISWDTNQQWYDEKYKYDGSDGFIIVLSPDQKGFWMKTTNDHKSYIVKQNWSAVQSDLLDYLP